MGVATAVLTRQMESFIQQDDDDEPIVPKVIGRCVIIPPDKRGPCSIAILADDIEAVELKQKGEFACGPCANRLLTLKGMPETDEDGRSNAKRKGGDHWKSSPRLPKGEDL